MSSRDSSGRDAHQASAGHTHLIAQISELLVQACKLGSVQSADQSGQIQQDAALPRRRGRQEQVGEVQLWSSLRLGCIAGHALICGLASPARHAVHRPVCSFVAHAQRLGQTAFTGWARSFARSVGACQCTTRPKQLSGGPRNARRFCNCSPLPG